MSYNDPNWSVFWSRGSDARTAPSGSTLFTGKHVGEDNDTARDDETVGYIVIETGHATSDGIEIETARGQDLPVGYVEGRGKKYTFNDGFSTTPAVAVLSQVAMDEYDGGWAVLAKAPNQNSMLVAIDEDQVGDSDRDHENEEVDYIVFSATGPVVLIPVTATTSPVSAPCSPELVGSAGIQSYNSMPIVINEFGNETVTFDVFQYWKTSTISWISTDYIPSGASAGGETCPKTETVGAGYFETVTAQCNNGVATVTLYVHDGSFDIVLDNADVPARCSPSQDVNKKAMYEFELPCSCNEEQD
jgi:hypothetical protein